MKGFPSVLVGVGMTDFHTNRESLKEKDLYDAGELGYRLLEAESHFAGESAEDMINPAHEGRMGNEYRK